MFDLSYLKLFYDFFLFQDRFAVKGLFKTIVFRYMLIGKCQLSIIHYTTVINTFCLVYSANASVVSRDQSCDTCTETDSVMSSRRGGWSINIWGVA